MKFITIEEYEDYIIKQINKYKNNEFSKNVLFNYIFKSIPVTDIQKYQFFGQKLFIKYNYRFKFETLCDLLYLNPKLFKYIHRDHPNYYKIYELYKYLTI
jgi:hypothetical protein